MTATGTRTTETRIKDSIDFLSGWQRGEFVPVRVVREALDLDPAEFDREMIRLFTEQKVNLIPQSFQFGLTQADWDAAVHVGGEAKHLVAWN